MASEKNISFNPGFRESNGSRRRYRLLCGSAGSGKSYNTAQDFIIRLSDPRFCGANLMVVRKTEHSARDSAFAELEGAVRRIFGESDIWKIRRDQMTMECRLTGNAVIFRGMNSAAARERVKSVSFAGGKLTWIWIEEATELEEADFDLLDDRLRGDLREVNPELYYQITMTFNPVSARHWIKRRFFDSPPSEDVFINRSVFGENRFIDGDFARRMERRREWDPEGYRIYALGEWGGAAEGLILPHFETVSMNRGDFDTVWYGQDFGFNHANCILEVGTKDGALCVLRELYVRGKDTGEIISMAREMGFSKTSPMYCDSAEPDRIKTWRQAGFAAMGVKKGSGSVISQIEFLRSHRLLVDPSCVNTISELSSWSWERDSVSGEFTDTPVNIKDDAMAALRYSTQMLTKSPKRTLRAEDLGL